MGRVTDDSAREDGQIISLEKRSIVEDDDDDYDDGMVVSSLSE